MEILLHVFYCSKLKISDEEDLLHREDFISNERNIAESGGLWEETYNYSNQL